jgi:hypothetical protein
MGKNFSVHAGRAQNYQQREDRYELNIRYGLKVFATLPSTGFPPAGCPPFNGMSSLCA